MNYEPLYISREAFDALGGWALKVYMLACNTERSLTSATIAQALHTSERTVQRAVVELKRKGFWSATNLSPETTNLSAKTTNLSPILKTEKERSKEKEKNSFTLECEYSHTREDFQIFFSWLSDDEQWRSNLCQQNRIKFQGTAAETLRPQMQQFLDWLLYLGEDLNRKGRDDTRKHFASWLPKHLPATNCPPELAYNCPPAQLAEQQAAKQAREQASEALFQQYDNDRENAVSYADYLHSIN